MVIDTSIKAVVVIAQDRRRNEVLKWNVTIRKGIERRDRATYGIDKKVRNDAVVECQACKRVSRNTEEALREITGALLRRRHVGDARNAFAGACAFVISEEERAI